MKKLKFNIFVVISATILCLTMGFKEYDLVPGLDPTGRTNITGAILYQLVGNATANTNKGLVVNSATRPNVTDNPRYTNFLWFDRNTLTLKYYTGSGDDNTNWQAVIGVSVIQGTNIGNYAVQAINMGTNSVQEYAISAGAVTSTKINDGQVVLGKLGPGAVTNGNLGFGSVTFDKILAGTIQTTNIADAAITAQKLANDAIGTAQLTNNSVTSDKIATNAVLNRHLSGNIVHNTNIIDGTIISNDIAPFTIISDNLHTNLTYAGAVAWAFCDSAGTLLKGFNIASVSKPSTGVYTFNFGSGFTPITTNYVVVATALTGAVDINTTVRSNLTTRVSVTAWTAGSVADDNPVYIVIYNFL